LGDRGISDGVVSASAFGTRFDMEGSVKFAFGADRRSGNDRRKNSGLNIRLLMGAGKRRVIRRHEDKKRIFYVDQYSPKHFAAIVGILFLSVIDGFMTLFLMAHGAYEINPVMSYYLNEGPYTFFTLKYALTITGAMVLLMFRNVGLRIIRMKTHSLLYFVVGALVMTVAWELYLVFNVVI
jgi:hypothetical protein